MAKQVISLLICDGCGEASLDGVNVRTLSMTRPGHLAIVKRWDLCPLCVIDLTSFLHNRPKSVKAVEVPL